MITRLVLFALGAQAFLTHNFRTPSNCVIKTTTEYHDRDTDFIEHLKHNAPRIVETSDVAEDTPLSKKCGFFNYGEDDFRCRGDLDEIVKAQGQTCSDLGFKIAFMVVVLGSGVCMIAAIGRGRDRFFNNNELNAALLEADTQAEPAPALPEENVYDAFTPG